MIAKARVRLSGDLVAFVDRHGREATCLVCRHNAAALAAPHSPAASAQRGQAVVQRSKRVASRAEDDPAKAAKGESEIDAADRGHGEE